MEPGATVAQAVLDFTAVEAAALGRTLGLAEILFWDGRRAQVLPCNTASSP